MADNQTIILRVTLDEQDTEKKLAQLVLSIEASRKAQTDLTAARKLGQVTDEAYSQQTVALRTQLKGQQGEYAALQKNLDLYRTATGELGNTYKGTQAQLSLAQRQYQELQGSQNTSTESTKALSSTIEQLRGTLAKTDETQGLFVRNIGNYPKGESLEPLIQQLVHLQEVQKSLPAGSEAAAKAQAQIGFQYGKINQEAAAAGKSADDVQNKLKGYGEAVRPAITNLVQLEKAQDEVAKSAGKESAEFAKIGFQIGATRKEIAAVPPELAKIPTTAETATKALTDTATKGLGLFGDQTAKVTGLLGKFKSGNDLVREGLSQIKGAGETGSLGLKAIAGGIALTGIGLFVIAISAVVTYFTQSAEGGKILAQALAALGAVVQVATDLVIGLGRSIVYAVTHPIEAIKTLGITLLNALEHPIDTARGLADNVGKLATRVKEAAVNGAALVAEQKALVVARRELEIEDVKEQSRVTVLLRLSKDRTLSAQEQLANLKEAGRIEAELTEKNIALQKRELAAIDAAIKQKGEGKAAELKADRGNKEKEIAQTLAALDETNAKIKTRESIFLQQEAKAQADAAKVAAAAAKQRAKDAVAAKQTENELALLEVAKGSAAELVLRQRAVDLAADAALAGEKKTAAQIKLVRAQAEGDKKDLLDAFTQKEIEAAKKRTAAQVAEVKREFAEAQQLLGDHLADKTAQADRDFAAGLSSENQHQKQLNEIQKAGLAAQLVNEKDYGQDQAKTIRAQASLEISEHQRVAAERKKIEETKRDIVEAGMQAAVTASDAVIEAFGAESAAGQVALTVKKILALAEIEINLEKQLAANSVAGAKIAAEAPPLTIPLGTAYVIATDALAITAAAASAAKILGFRQGGLIQGPSHEEGGVPFTVGGRHGFEAEGGEVILAKGVWDNPLLRPIVSYINVMGGGRPLTARAYMADGGVASTAYGRQLLAGNVGAPGGAASPVVVQQPIDYRKLASAMQQTHLSVSVRDTKAAAGRDAFTESLANS
ncbi:MAG: hypothetical protein ACRYFR_04875 [Janthinobacterium lividum]